MEENLKRYTASYYFKGKKWCTEVYALSSQEAEEKLKAISQAKVDGEVHCSIYVPVKKESFIARLIASIARKFSK